MLGVDSEYHKSIRRRASAPCAVQCLARNLPDKVWVKRAWTLVACTSGEHPANIWKRRG